MFILPVIPPTQKSGSIVTVISFINEIKNRTTSGK